MRNFKRFSTNLSCLSLALFVTLGVLVGTEQKALALQGGEDPALLPVLVDKRHGTGGRHELSLMFSTTMVTKFVEALGPYATYTYGFSDLLGLEISGGYFLGSEASIMAEVRNRVPGQEPVISDLFQEQWTAQAAILFVPLYGKMSFASELDPAFDMFLVAGGGVAGLRKQVGSEANPPKTFESVVAPSFNFGAGFRFYFSRLVALRLELRDFFYPEQGKDPMTGEGLGGFTFNLHFQGGLQFNFGGE